MYHPQFVDPRFITDWCEIDLINCCPREPITCLVFDPMEELVWNATATGRIQSHFCPTLLGNTSFYAHKAIRAFQPLGEGVISLGVEGYRYTSNQGVLKFASHDPMVQDMNHFSYLKNQGCLTFSGYSKNMCTLDLASGGIINESRTDTRCTSIMKASSRFTCRADSSGTIFIHDSMSLEVIHSYKPHSGEILDLAIHGSLLASCGYSQSSMGGIETVVKILNLKTLTELCAISSPACAYLLNFQPKLTGVLSMVSQAGRVEFHDIQGATTIPRIYQLDSHEVTCFDISSSSNIICLGTEGGSIRQWISKADVTVNDFSILGEYATHFPIPSFIVDEHTPLTMVAESLPAGERYLSEWEDIEYPINNISAPLPKSIVQQTFTRRNRWSPMNNVAQKKAGRQLNENHIYTNISLSKKEIAPSSFPLVKKEIPRPPIKFRKPSPPGKLGQITMNHTSYTSLDNTFVESHINTIIQNLFFFPPIRERLLHHICAREFCIACEFGFLFHYMEKAKGQIAPNTNFLRTLQHIPTKGHREKESTECRENCTLYSSTLPNALDEILDQLCAELEGTPRNVIKDSFISHISIKGNYSCCGAPYQVNDRQGRFCLRYPKTKISPTFHSLLQHSIREREFHCRNCNLYSKTVLQSCECSLSPYLIVQTNIQTDGQLDLWVPSSSSSSSSDSVHFVPQHIFITPEGSVHDIDPTKQYPPSSSIFRLATVVCQIIDKKAPAYQSQTHFVTYINIPKPYERSYMVKNEPDPPIQYKGEGWFLFNDISVTKATANAVLQFSAWKVPSVLIYERIDIQNRKYASHPANAIVIPDNIFVLENPLLKCRINPLKQAESIITKIEDLPRSGDIVAIDTEFVSLAPAQTVTISPGRTTKLRPQRSSLARVSVLVWKENESDKVILDDYVVSRQPIADYLTRFSGILPGDLNPCSSSHAVVTLKSMYLKLRVLVDRGCILVGHGLKKDFWICNLFVPPEQVRDTVDLFRLPYQRLISLRFLASYLLGANIQGVTHDSIEDASTALHLLLKYNELQKKGSFNQVIKELYDLGHATQWKLEQIESVLAAAANSPPSVSSPIHIE